jgi:membrane associated rhomboid family serine protease
LHPGGTTPKIHGRQRRPNGKELLVVFPLGDDNSDRRTIPWINYAIIALNVFVFVVFQQMGENQDFVYKFSCVPKEILTGHDVVTEPQIVVEPTTGQRVEIPGLEKTPIPVWLTIFTAMFMHGGFAHIAGNMWFLWIFGDNVEDRIGHVKYLIFYLLSGVIATMAHVLVNSSGAGATIPSLGASGAISGVLGAYIVLYPHRQVLVVLVRVLTHVPAWVAVGIWFVFQVIEGSGALGGEAGDGVAYAAHVGGFVFGVVAIKIFDAFPWPRPPTQIVRMPWDEPRRPG